MSNKLSDLLQNRTPEPADFAIIREFIKKEWQFEPKLAQTTRAITITVPSAAVAGELRYQLPKLESLCSGGKRLVIRLGV